MNAQRTSVLTHFGPLFLTALGGWMAFHLANNGTLFLVPGLVVAALIAYGGTLVALRTRTMRDVRPVAPPVRTARQYPAFTAPRGVFTMQSSEPRYEMDIAAGD
ncbi:MAG: hypothetical protein ACR2JW_15380 [Thermomicrobiales bacterium]